MSAHVGKKDQARQLIESIRPASGAQLPMMAGIAEVLAMIGEAEDAERVVQGFHLLSMETAISRFRQALLSQARGDGEAALSFLKLAQEDREPELVWIGVDPRFDSIRGTAGFKTLVSKVAPQLIDGK
jgi:hypothetical protein